ncbi:hypothetical protein [Kitasatospora sp. NPDC093679]|uniref:hypothetical protein n=1 Tax=Kitasatospora sp. NPDC093679 TaxID=3154983 RepID=UPI0034136FE0
MPHPIKALRTDEERARWLADHLTEHGVPAESVAMGGPCHSAQVLLTVGREALRLLLAWDTDLLLWQLEAHDHTVLLDGTWSITPGRSAQSVRRLITALDAEVASPSYDFGKASWPSDFWELGGHYSAGQLLTDGLTSAGLHPRPVTVDGVPYVEVGTGYGLIRVTTRALAEGNRSALHTGWRATHVLFPTRLDEGHEVVIYEGDTELSPSADTAACVAAVGALAAVHRHRRESTVGARIRAALLERGIPSGDAAEREAVDVTLPDGSQLWISDEDGALDYQLRKYHGVHVWHYPGDPEDGEGNLVLDLRQGDIRRGKDGFAEDLPVLTRFVDEAVLAACEALQHL